MNLAIERGYNRIMSNPTKNDAIIAAFAHEYTDLEEYVKDIAREHCIANMGMRLEDFCRPTDPPGKLIHYAFQQLMREMENDEMADGTMDEYRSWLKEARRDALKVQKKGFALTIANSRDAFEGKGPFAKKASLKK